MTETLVGASMRLRFSVSGYWPSMWAVPRLERSASARRRCRCSSIRCVHVDALPIPHRTDTSPKCVFGASVRVLPRGVQRRAAGPRRRTPGWGATVRLCDSAPSHHSGENHRPARVAGRGTECGIGAIGQRRASGMAQLLRLKGRTTEGPEGWPAANEVKKGSPAVVSAHTQRLFLAPKWAAICSESGRAASALVSGTSEPPVVGHDHSRTGRALLRELCRRRAVHAAPGASARSWCRSRHQSVGNDCCYRPTATGHREPETLIAQATQAAPPRAREVSSAERIEQQGEDAAQGRHNPWQGGSRSAGLSPQAGAGVGSRKPSDPRRGSEHCGDGCQPPFSPLDRRCWVGAVRADHRRKGRPLRAHRASCFALACIEQDLLGMPASIRRATAKDPELDLPGMPCRSRPRPQRRQEHSRRRTGGETKRLPCKWAGPRRRFWWSPGKPSLPSRGPGR